MSERGGRLQERKRRAVRADIVEAAEQLFMTCGYTATTIDDIAAKLGMSARTVYRYFPAKDDILVGRFADSTDALVEALKARPHTELAWVSLRAAFEPLTGHADGQHDRESVRRVHRAIFSTPALLGRYLQQLYAAQLHAAEALRARPQIARFLNDTTAGDAALLAIIGTAFACFVAAQETWSRRDDTLSLSFVLDRAMAAASPTTQMF
jgi:AcrR family transcriptional regulator